MEKQEPTKKDRSEQTEHRPIDPGRSAARESREPGKRFEPRRSEPDSTPRRKDADRD
jgi:hypothetical protein